MHLKTILITGAAKRIGACIARNLHEQGANVVLHCNHSLDSAQSLVNELNTIKANSAKVIQGDLSQPDQINEIASQAINAFGSIDGLINNASSFYPKTFGEYDQQDWQTLIGSNLQGPFFLSQALLKQLHANQGVIINIIDIHAQSPLSNHTLYCMAKAGLSMMTKSLAKDLAPNIRVNGVAPGAILWPENSMDDAQKQQIMQQIPLARLGQDKDIADAVSYLIQAQYVTGQILAIDGGKSLN
ncbi:pteridine reductase [Alteromonadaceae bacterium BrNp21-10]|nr:pteridine reductase [Alteromonadaceae bacterium BrNp21-10]